MNYFAELIRRLWKCNIKKNSLKNVLIYVEFFFQLIKVTSSSKIIFSGTTIDNFYLHILKTIQRRNKLTYFSSFLLRKFPSDTNTSTKTMNWQLEWNKFKNRNVNMYLLLQYTIQCKHWSINDKKGRVGFLWINYGNYWRCRFSFSMWVGNINIHWTTKKVHLDRFNATTFYRNK